MDAAGAALAIGKQGADPKVAQKPTGCEGAAQNNAVAGGDKAAGGMAARAYAAISTRDDVTDDTASALDARDPEKGKKAKGKGKKKAVAKVATREDTTDTTDDTANNLDRREPKKGMKGKEGKEKAACKTA